MIRPREIQKKEKQKKEQQKKSSSRRRRRRPKRTVAGFAGAAVAEDAVARGRRVLGEVWNPSAQEAAVAEDAAAEGRATVAVSAPVVKKVVFNDQLLSFLPHRHRYQHWLGLGI